MARPRIERQPLKQVDIKAVKPGEKDQFLWDHKEHGLGVKITPRGSRVFILQKSIRGRVKRITLGKLGDITLEAARTEARKLNGIIAANRDPVAESKAKREEEERKARQEKTVRHLWERYEADRAKGQKPNKVRTLAEKRRMWARRIEPAIGKLKIKDVTQDEVEEVVRAPIRISGSGKVSGNGEAGNLYRLLNHMFHKALIWGLRPRELGNPLEGVDEPKVERRSRVLLQSEVVALIRETDRSISERPSDRTVLLAIKMALQTGARISEILKLRWDEVRADENEIHFSDTKAGASHRPVSPEAMETIGSIDRMPGSPYVFRAPHNSKVPIGYNAVEKAFRGLRQRAGIHSCTLHTLRHWFATVTANSVNNPRVGMKLTGHKSYAAYMNYVHAENDQAHELATQIGALTGKLGAAASNVEPLPQRQHQRSQ